MSVKRACTPCGSDDKVERQTERTLLQQLGYPAKGGREQTRKDRTYKLLLEHHVSNLIFPSCDGCRKFSVKITSSCGICGALADLKLNEELACGFSSLGQH